MPESKSMMAEVGAGDDGVGAVKHRVRGIRGGSSGSDESIGPAIRVCNPHPHSCSPQLHTGCAHLYSRLQRVGPAIRRLQQLFLYSRLQPAIERLQRSFLALSAPPRYQGIADGDGDRRRRHKDVDKIMISLEEIKINLLFHLAIHSSGRQ
jgi:hypothetical protein